MFDIVIKNGHVIDSCSKVSSALNIGICEGKIALISNESISGKQEIDAEGLIVSPGFIDIHVHEDIFDKSTNKFSSIVSDSMLRMGVTTVVAGNCGVATGGDNPIEYLDAVDRIGLSTNLAMLSPHQVLRNGIGITDVYQKTSSEENYAMGEMLKVHLDQGCFGVSLGIEYIPGIDIEEMKVMMKIASQFDSITAIHMRSDAEESISSLSEMIEATESEKSKLQISHIGSMCGFGQMKRVLAQVDAARMKGLNAAFDCYPYNAFCTTIGSACFDDGFMDSYLLSDNDFHLLEIASGKLVGTACTKELFEKLRKTEPDTFIIGHLMKQQEIEMALTHPACIIASDAVYINGQGHPRGSGTFPKFINEYVNEKKMLSVEQCLEKITLLPAQRYKIPKGNLKIGSDADITIFDLKRIKDQADFRCPTKNPIGIEYVLIGGEMALCNSRIVNNKLGRAIRKIST